MEDITVINELYETQCWQDEEIVRLRAQVEQLTADAIIRANRQAILIEAMKRISAMFFLPSARDVAREALAAIGELQP